MQSLNAQTDVNVERVWLETSQRKYRELVEGKAKSVPGALVLQRLRARCEEVADLRDLLCELQNLPLTPKERAKLDRCLDAYKADGIPVAWQKR